MTTSIELILNHPGQNKDEKGTNETSLPRPYRPLQTLSLQRNVSSEKYVLGGSESFSAKMEKKQSQERIKAQEGLVIILQKSKVKALLIGGTYFYKTKLVAGLFGSSKINTRC